MIYESDARGERPALCCRGGSVLKSGQSINSHLKWRRGNSHLIVFRLMRLYSRGKRRGTTKKNYKNQVGLWSFKPSGVIYCTLKAHSGIYSGSGDFPCKAAGLTCKPGLPLAPSRPLAAQKPSSVKSSPVQRRLVTVRVCVCVCAVNLYQHLYVWKLFELNARILASCR